MDRREFLGKSVAGAFVGTSFASILSACSSWEKKCGPDYKIGICDWNFRKAENLANFDDAKAFGLEGIQISKKDKSAGMFVSPDLMAKYKAKIKETGIEVASVAPTHVHVKRIMEKRGECVELVCSAVDAAYELNCTNMLIPLFHLQDFATRKTVEPNVLAIIDFFKEVAPYAEKKNVYLSMEDSISSKDNKRIIDAVGSDHLKVYLDIYNCMHYGHDTIPEILELRGGYIGQVHMKHNQSNLLSEKGGWPADTDKCIDALLDVGYKGWLVLEFHGYDMKKYKMTYDDLIKANVEYLKNSKFFKA